MSAVELQRAANIQRNEWASDLNVKPFASAAAIHMAIAEWLDHEAARVYAAAEAGTDATIAPAALKAARLILGGVR